jgi:hypothetical protein
MKNICCRCARRSTPEPIGQYAEPGHKMTGRHSLESPKVHPALAMAFSDKVITVAPKKSVRHRIADVRLNQSPMMANL